MRANEYGVQLQVSTDGMSLVGCTDLRLRWRLFPNGQVKEASISLPASGTSFTYTTQPGDFPRPGTYKVSVQAQYGATEQLRSGLVDLVVDESLDAP